MKTYIKSKTASGLGFRTPAFFRGGLPAQAGKFGNKGKTSQPKFNPSQFRTQHKGGS